MRFNGASKKMKQKKVNQGEAVCHDCKKVLENGDAVMAYENLGNEYYKCEACHKKDPVLRNFQKTEVYSRIVGYIRPVGQWNVGKAQEFSDRKEFVVEGGGCC